MATESLSCANCGAPVTPLPHSEFVFCAHCGSRLRINSSTGSPHTEIARTLEAVRVGVEAGARSSETAALELRLSRLTAEVAESRQKIPELDEQITAAKKQLAGARSIQATKRFFTDGCAAVVIFFGATLIAVAATAYLATEGSDRKTMSPAVTCFVLVVTVIGWVLGARRSRANDERALSPKVEDLRQRERQRLTLNEEIARTEQEIATLRKRLG